jgi:hypothetical protein
VRPPALWLPAPFAAAFIAALATCRTATQVTVVLSTDVNCVAAGGAADGGVTIETTLYSGDGSGTFASVKSADTTACDPVPDPATGLHRIGSIVLVPSGSKDGAFGVEAIASLAGVDADRCKAYFDEAAPDPDNTLKTSCIKETRDLSFIPHDDSRTLEIILPDECLGVVCVPGQTCALDGKCVPEPSCASSGDCPPPVDDGGAADARASDAVAADGGIDGAPPDGSSLLWSHAYPTGTTSVQFADHLILDYQGGAVLFAGSYTGALPLADAGAAFGAAGFAAGVDPSRGTIDWVSLVPDPASVVASPESVGPVVGGPPPDAGTCFVALVGPSTPVGSPTPFGGAECTLGGLGGAGDAGMRASGVTSPVTLPPLGNSVLGAFEADLTDSAQFTLGGEYDNGKFTSATFARFAESAGLDGGIGHAAAVVILPPADLEVVTNDARTGTLISTSLTSPAIVADASIPFEPVSAAVAVDPNGKIAVACLYTGPPPQGINAPNAAGARAVFVATFDPNVVPGSLTTITSTGARVGGFTLSPDALGVTFPVDVYVGGAGTWGGGTTTSDTGFYVLHVDPADAAAPAVKAYPSNATINHLAVVAILPHLVLAGGYSGGYPAPLEFDDGTGHSTSDPSDIFIAKITPP